MQEKDYQQSTILLYFPPVRIRRSGMNFVDKTKSQTAATEKEDVSKGYPLFFRTHVHFASPSSLKLDFIYNNCIFIRSVPVCLRTAKEYYFSCLDKNPSPAKAGSPPGGRKKSFYTMGFQWPQNILGLSECYEACCGGIEEAILSERAKRTSCIAPGKPHSVNPKMFCSLELCSQFIIF